MSHIHHDQKRLLHRIRRLRGQVDGVERAVLEDKPCGDVLLTLAACRGAVNALMSEILEGHLRHHVLGGKAISADQRKAADELMNVINRYLK